MNDTTCNGWEGDWDDNEIDNSVMINSTPDGHREFVPCPMCGAPTGGCAVCKNDLRCDEGV